MTPNERVKKHYYKTKAKGYVRIYALMSGDTVLYVGSTTNYLPKRLWQHKAKGSKTRVIFEENNNVYIKLLSECSPKDRGEEENKYISKYMTEYNKHFAKRVRQVKECYKGGIHFEDKWYPSKLALWKDRGVTEYNTFKTRLHRKGDIFYALGIN